MTPPSLFDDPEAPGGKGPAARAPLAERMRPRTLDEFVGQEDLLAPGQPLRQAIERDLLQSIILWGPPGTGKTTLARMHRAITTQAHFISFSAVLSGIKEISAVMAEAETARRRLGRRTILFVDEIHRFNKAQQDAFLPRVEAGDIVLIGATTENPSFEVNSALLSRSKVFVLQAARHRRHRRDPRAPRARGSRARARRPRASSSTTTRWRASRATRTATRASALNLLELAAGVAVEPRRPPDRRGARWPTSTAAPRAPLRQERRGALQPDLRAAQVDAQQRSRRGGLLAGAHARGRRRPAVHRAAAGALRVGRRRQRRSAGAGRSRSPRRTRSTSSGCPRATPRSRRRPSTWPPRRRATPSIAAYDAAAEDAAPEAAEPVPLHLRNAPTRLMKELDYGKGYRYAHDERRCGRRHGLPAAGSLRRRVFYEPTERGFEKEIKRRLDALEGHQRSKRRG